jgi:hypothetical protein
MFECLSQFFDIEFDFEYVSAFWAEVHYLVYVVLRFAVYTFLVNHALRLHLVSAVQGVVVKDTGEISIEALLILLLPCCFLTHHVG